LQADLPDYYERELGYLRQTAQEFAEKYPKIASRLVLGEKDNPDPHVERLLEGFAFLAARIHVKLDDDFPEITDALLNLIYPHYIRPIPSMTVAEFELDPQQGKLTTGFTIASGSMVYSRPVQGLPCKFRTAYETTLWPLEIAEADWRSPDKLQPPVRGGGAAGIVRILLRCGPEMTFERLAISSLRFYIRSEISTLAHTLYELLLNNCTQILVRDPINPKRPPVRLSADNLRPVGFEENEALLPYPRRSFDGYRLLQEYFAFPQKFQFIELQGLEEVVAARFQQDAEVLFFIAPFEREDRWAVLERTNTPTFRLGCTPVVNLFPQTSEPILMKHTDYEYRVVPDVRRQRGLDVFSIDSVVSATTGSGEVTHYDPFFSFRHADDRARKQAFWYATRRHSRWNDRTETYISLVDFSGARVVPDVEAITARLTCSNADLPSRLPFGGANNDFELEGGGPIRAIKALERPTPPILPKTGRAAFWHLISHLALNHLSLVAEGREALQEILQLYNFEDSPSTRRQIQAIRSLEAQPHFARIISEHGITFARGYKVEMQVDEEAFAGAGVFLFASVIERFLGMYATLNSFSQLLVRTPQRKEVLRQWQPRAGRKILM
jgi:type VI secretion system protein ImpG